MNGPGSCLGMNGGTCLPDFGCALRHLKLGNRVTRKGWHGKGMWLALLKGESWAKAVSTTTDFILPPDWAYETLPFILMRTADGGLVPWLASQTDLLAVDWELVTRADQGCCAGSCAKEA